MCIFFHLYHIFIMIKKCVQKHNTVYINKPTRNVIHLHSEVKKICFLKQFENIFWMIQLYFIKCDKNILQSLVF